MVILRRDRFKEEPAPSNRSEPSLHDRLVLRAERWLIAQGCGVVVRSPFKALTAEIPDAIGWREGVSVLVEVKSTREDFFADRKKEFRSTSELGMGDWRFYFCPPDVIDINEVPEGWGLVWSTEKRVTQTFGVPSNSMWFQSPFQANHLAERSILVSALRRHATNGRLPILYANTGN